MTYEPPSHTVRADVLFKQVHSSSSSGSGLDQVWHLCSAVFSLLRCSCTTIALPVCAAHDALQVGFKLLAFDARVASGLALKAMRGNQLTR
jgi:hypothetical protein